MSLRNRNEKQEEVDSQTGLKTREKQSGTGTQEKNTVDADENSSNNMPENITDNKNKKSRKQTGNESIVESQAGRRVTRSRSRSVEKDTMEGDQQTEPEQEKQEIGVSIDKDMETKYVLKETPVKTPNKNTARMRVGGDTRKMLLKQVKKRTQGIKGKRKPPKRSPKGPRGPPVDAEDLLKGKDAMNTMQNTNMQDQYLYAHSISEQRLGSKVHGFPIRQKVTQVSKANAQTKSGAQVCSALKEDNRGGVQIHAKKMLNKAKGVKQTKARISNSKTGFVKELFHQVEGVVMPVSTTAYPAKKTRGPIPNFGSFLDQHQETSAASFGCLSDSDNENIPLNRQSNAQKSKGTKGKPSQSPLVHQKSMGKKRKGGVLVSQQDNDTAHMNDRVAVSKSNRNFEVDGSADGAATPEKESTVDSVKPVVQVVDISPLIDRSKLSHNSQGAINHVTDDRFEQYGDGSDLANPLAWEEECDDYELVEMMSRPDVLDCSQSTSPSERVALFRGQLVSVRPTLVVSPLPPVDELDIPDAIRASILYQKAKESEKKDYERDSELVLNCGYQWMRVPVGGPRYPASTLRHLSKMNRTNTEYWRQMHTPSARFTRAKRRMVKRRAPTATTTRAEYMQQHGVAHGAAAVSPKHLRSFDQSASDSSTADYPRTENSETMATPEEGNSSIGESEDSKMDDVKSNATEDSNRDQSDDVFISPLSSLPDVRNLIPLRATRLSKRIPKLVDIEEESSTVKVSDVGTTEVVQAPPVVYEPPIKKRRRGRRKSFNGPVKSDLTEQEARDLLKTQFSDSCDSQEEVDLNRSQEESGVGNQSDKSSQSETDGTKESQSVTSDHFVRCENPNGPNSQEPNKHLSEEPLEIAECANAKTVEETPSAKKQIESKRRVKSAPTDKSEKESIDKESSRRSSLCKELNQILESGFNWLSMEKRSVRKSKESVPKITERKSRYENNVTKHLSPEKKSSKIMKSPIRKIVKPLFKKSARGRSTLARTKVTKVTKRTRTSISSADTSTHSDTSSVATSNSLSSPETTDCKPVHSPDVESTELRQASSCSITREPNDEKPKAVRQRTRRNQTQSNQTAESHDVPKPLPKDQKLIAQAESQRSEIGDMESTNHDETAHSKKTKSEIQEYEDNDTKEKGDVGTLVWARLGRQQMWPAIVIHGCHCGMKPAKVGNIWVYWWADQKVSQVVENVVEPFSERFSEHFVNSCTKLYRESVLEGIQECWTRADLPLVAGGTRITDDEFLSWAKGGFVINTKINHDLFLPKSEQPLSQFVLNALSDVSNKIFHENESELFDDWITGEEDETPQRLFRIERKLSPETGLNLVKAGLKKIEDVCISCDDPKEKIVVQHPLFHGGLCEDCKNDIMESIFAFGEDGTNVYCVTCGNGGSFFVCENTQCNRVYCTGCVRDFINEDAINRITNTDDWLCFLCTPYTKRTHGLFHTKSDWQQNIIKLFQPKRCIQRRQSARQQRKIFESFQGPPMPSKFDRRPIRILSLFDGIATGNLVMEELGIDVDVYYASEIDADAVTVSSARFPSIYNVGDVRDLTENEIKKMCPIDLLIGGSPCNDLCTVNPSRRGLNDLEGTGPLFYEFHRIMNVIQQLNGDQHLFWLFENVAKMSTDVRATISRFLKCEPALWDAVHFTAQRRRRYFWGNVPGMYSPPQHAVPDKTSVDLNDFLMPSRNASMKTMPPLTTRTQRKNPIQKGETGERMWIPELEKVFGFPEHYTDVGDLAPTKRQRLLGKSWSVPVMKHLFRPLTQFFAMKTAELDQN